MMRLHCPACGRALQVQEALAGKRGRCPRCKATILIPDPAPPCPQSPPTQAEEMGLPERQMRLKERPPDGPSLEASPPAWAVPEPAAPAPAGPKGLRRHPWPLDVLLYPTSVSAMVNLAVFGFLLLLDNLVARVGVPYGQGLRVGYGGLTLLYVIYYLTDCVRDSADGGTRAPDNLTSMPDFKGALAQVQDILVTILVFALPAGLAYLIRRRIDPVFWTAVACSAFVLPMALLSVILFDSLSGLNPKTWLVSIGRVFLPYLGLVLVLASMIALMAGVVQILPWTLIGFLFSSLTVLYAAMIAAHILGRFYFRYDKSIGWGI
ncbi:MAG: hypothetical protein KBE04_09485 [Phycisphaerae bacterium]|nr:hypothetical protein [Phycisphaerae bacterium]